MEQEEQNITGLTSEEVQKRIAKGEVNADAGVKTRSVKQIVIENICTLFNAINAILAVFVLITGSYKNALFMLVIILNTLIGIVQEIRSKRTTDKLSVIAGTKADVLRNGKEQEIPLNQIVLDDVIVLGRGDQVPADCKVIEGECKMDESLLTGESRLISKKVGDELLSGTFVNSGKVYACVFHVGAENYAAKITDEAKQRKAINSEIMRTLNGIIKFVSIIIFPLGALLFCSQFFGSDTPVNDIILSTVSALVGMIPEGLILLTSTVLAVAVVRLAKYDVLVQQLYCIETLARVDVLCLDKTGTITTGGMTVSDIIAFNDSDTAQLDLALASLVYADDDPNDTAEAIRKRFEGAHTEKAKRMIPFSSDTKWSGVQLEDGKCYVMGAGQFIMGDEYKKLDASKYEVPADCRILLFAQVDGFDSDSAIIGMSRPMGLITLHDEIRATAAQTIGYFKEQGVTLKVISGDDPRTVSAIAAKVGVPNADKYVDATTLDTDEKIAEAIEEYSVFGRVTPEQKKAFVLALQAKGHVVAMTGDGVNDTLALKAADCSVAMASGSDAARNVAQLVLVNNDFASMPKVVAEGRRSINNLQRSASLFLVKTLLSMTLAICFVILAFVLNYDYPFQPIQMTLVSAFTIGLPSFVLALEPNHDRIRGHFLQNVIVRSIPGAVCAVLAILVVNFVGYEALGLDYGQVSTLCVLLLAWVGILLIVRLSIPYTPIRAALLIVCVGGLAICCVFMPNLFNIVPLTLPMVVICCICAAVMLVIFQFLYNATVAWNQKRLDKTP